MNAVDIGWPPSGLATSGAVIAGALADVLSAIPDVRAWPYLPDPFLPPGIVVGQPELSFTAEQATFCSQSWTWPVYLVVARTSERHAQGELYRLLDAALAALAADPDLHGTVAHAHALSARPQTITAGGVDLPGYTLTVAVLE